MDNKYPAGFEKRILIAIEEGDVTGFTRLLDEHGPVVYSCLADIAEKNKVSLDDPRLSELNRAIYQRK